MKWIGGYIEMGLKFDDIDEWTPSSISIVDEPSHPCCHFEVYLDDEEYVKKSIEINEGESMVNENQPTEEPMVQAPVSFFERLLGRTVAKAEEVPEEPPKPPEEKSDLEARIEKLEARIAKLESAAKSEEESETAPGAVTKSEGEAEGEAEGETSEEATEEETATTEEDETVDEEEVVVKSKSIDPDLVSTTSTDKSLVERAGRNTNGMTW
jgi:hypothetical protein